MRHCGQALVITVRILSRADMHNGRALAGRAHVLPRIGHRFAETIDGLYKAEVIHWRAPWRSFKAVEFAILAWVYWFNNPRLPV
jgi:hypothetical protein